MGERTVIIRLYIPKPDLQETQGWQIYWRVFLRGEPNGMYYE